MSRRRGRNRKPGHRKPSGGFKEQPTVQRYENMTAVVMDARERVFGLSKKQAARMRDSSELGRLEATGEISIRQYRAGHKYISVVQERNRMVEIKSYPLAGDLDRQAGHDSEDGVGPSPKSVRYRDRFDKAKERWDLCQGALRSTNSQDRLAASVVDAVCMADWALPDMVASLRIGLNALVRALGLADEGVDKETERQQASEIEAGALRRAAAT